MTHTRIPISRVEVGETYSLFSLKKVLVEVISKTPKRIKLWVKESDIDLFIPDSQIEFKDYKYIKFYTCN